MSESPVVRLLESVKTASTLYFRLVLVVAPVGEGKTKVLNEASEKLDKPVTNVNLELSRLLLDLTQRQRILQLPRLLEKIVDGSPGDVVLLDNIELLFDPTLRQDPLRLLQGLSRSRTIVCSWNGTFEDGYVTYATIGHPEYRRYQVRDFLVVTPTYKLNGR